MLSDYSWKHKGWKKHLYWPVFEKKTVHHATAFHATSEQEKQDILGVRPQARVYVIPNGVEQEAFDVPHVRDRTVIRDLFGGTDMPVVLCLARLHPVKGIVDRLLPAVAMMRQDCRLLLIGGEDTHYPGYKQDIEAAIRRLELQDRVYVMDAVTGKGRWSYFDMADIFVLVSHTENFGVVIAEAMARGCPVVVTRQVQSSPLVVQANAGVAVNGHVDEIADAMDSLLADPDRRKAMSASGKKYAENNLNWNYIAKQVIDMYQDCLAES